MPKIIYQEPHREIVLDQEPGGTILEASLANGIAHYHACGGKGRCTTCRVLVVDGAASLLPRTDAELRLARRRSWPDEIRLACQARLAGRQDPEGRFLREVRQVGGEVRAARPGPPGAAGRPRAACGSRGSAAACR